MALAVFFSAALFALFTTSLSHQVQAKSNGLRLVSGSSSPLRSQPAPAFFRGGAGLADGCHREHCGIPRPPATDGVRISDASRRLTFSVCLLPYRQTLV